MNFFVHRVVESKAARLGEVLVDEMHVSIAEKAGLQALRASAIVISLILIAVIRPFYFGVYVVPREAAERLYPGLGPSFAILVISYISFSLYYVVSKKAIE